MLEFPGNFIVISPAYRVWGKLQVFHNRVGCRDKKTASISVVNYAIYMEKLI